MGRIKCWTDLSFFSLTELPLCSSSTLSVLLSDTRGIPPVHRLSARAVTLRHTSAQRRLICIQGPPETPQPGLPDHSLGYQTTAWATRPQPGLPDHSLGYQTTAWANRPQPGLPDHSLGYQTTAWATRPQPGLPDHSLGYQTTAWATRPQPGLPDHSLGYWIPAWAIGSQPGLRDGPGSSRDGVKLAGVSPIPKASFSPHPPPSME
ncbi:unnamed protein product [Arctogadus glacialis]